MVGCYYASQVIKILMSLLILGPWSYRDNW